ncbi:MAG: DUF4349 domain-containing protein [Hyphomonadaceae bacterium]|nr:DUF4349 domain-containing protein [Hyphomonadaceae bacterium]
MKYRLAAGLSALVLLAACGGGRDDYERSASGPVDMVYEEMDGAMPAPAPAAIMTSPKLQDQIQTGGNANDPAPEAPEQYIAYSHSLGLRLPVAAVEPVMAGHVAACEAAGPTLCIVTNSRFNNQSDEYASGSLSLRAKPDWIETFLAGIDSEAEAANGEVSYRNTSAEDLTRAIIDTDARLTAQRTLQTRLQTLLETRDGDLNELLAVERELARVTSEIESTDSYLKALRLRVSMSQLSVNYETKISAVGPQRFNPLGEALSDFFFNLSSGLAGVITAFAVGLPWLFLLGVMLFIWLRVIWPRIRRKKS